MDLVAHEWMIEIIVEWNTIDRIPLQQAHQQIAQFWWRAQWNPVTEILANSASDIVQSELDWCSYFGAKFGVFS